MLPDHLAPDLRVVFVGTSVATASAARRHYYAGPGNRFWSLLFVAGLTGDRQLAPEDDASVLEHGIGLTDLVKHVAASSDSLLRGSDYDVPGFLATIDAFGPAVVAFNGKEAARRVFTAAGARRPGYGLSEVRLGPARTFVLPSSSGAGADRRPLAPKASKDEWWCELGDLVRSLGD